MPNQKYVEWCSWAWPFQFVRSPLWAGSSDVPAPNGEILFHVPSIVRLYAAPVFELGGAKSMTPSSEPLSLSRSLGTPPTVSGICFPFRMESSRFTESGAIPAVINPSESVFSSVARWLDRWPSWYEKL